MKTTEKETKISGKVTKIYERAGMEKRSGSLAMSPTNYMTLELEDKEGIVFMRGKYGMEALKEIYQDFKNKKKIEIDGVKIEKKYRSFLLPSTDITKKGSIKVDGKKEYEFSVIQCGCIMNPHEKYELSSI